ncbi:MAG: T9SS type A sorting domain-containing protein [Sphingobacteriaceae bacterium]|nr:MAG: T9SS type A sorting domain-containing protein [Sphingobacteriaceae bacterium]
MNDTIEGLRIQGNVMLENQTRHLVFVLLHAKANTGTDAEKRESYNRRKQGINNMKDSLDANFSTANIIILGDYNDKLSGTIAPTTGADTVSSYRSFVVDSTDANSYKSLTLPFVNVGTTSAGNAAIDNLIVSNELAPYYLPNSLQIRKDVADLVSSYASTTTDHYPIFSRFYLNQVVLPVAILKFAGSKSGSSALLSWQVGQELNVAKYIVECSTDGKTFKAIGVVVATGSKSYQFTHTNPAAGNNFYRLKAFDKDGKAAVSATVRLNFGDNWQITLSPNPVKDVLYLQSSKAGQFSINVYDATGRKVVQFPKLEMAAGETKQLSLSQLAKGTYTVEVTSASLERVISKLIAE